MKKNTKEEIAIETLSPTDVAGTDFQVEAVSMPADYQRQSKKIYKRLFMGIFVIALAVVVLLSINSALKKERKPVLKEKEFASDVNKDVFSALEEKRQETLRKTSSLTPSFSGQSEDIPVMKQNVYVPTVTENASVQENTPSVPLQKIVETEKIASQTAEQVTKDFKVAFAAPAPVQPEAPVAETAQALQPQPTPQAVPKPVPTAQPVVAKNPSPVVAVSNVQPKEQLPTKTEAIRSDISENAPQLPNLNREEMVVVSSPYVAKLPEIEPIKNDETSNISENEQPASLQQPQILSQAVSDDTLTLQQPKELLPEKAVFKNLVGPLQEKGYTLQDALQFRDSFLTGSSCVADYKKIDLLKGNPLADLVIQKTTPFCTENEGAPEKLLTVFKKNKKKVLAAYYSTLEPKWKGRLKIVFLYLFNVRNLKPSTNSLPDMMDRIHLLLEKNDITQALKLTLLLPEQLKSFMAEFFKEGTLYMEAKKALNELVLSFERSTR